MREKVWIDKTDDLPDHDTIVKVKFRDGSIKTAQLVKAHSSLCPWIWKVKSEATGMWYGQGFSEVTYWRDPAYHMLFDNTDRLENLDI